MSRPGPGSHTESGPGSGPSRGREMEELKQVIRSIVESNGNEITLRALLRQYRSINETNIPLTRFGYHSVIELIHDMDDIFGLQVTDQMRNQMDYVVYCQLNAINEHIVDMVRHQRGGVEEGEDNNSNRLHPIRNSGPKHRYQSNRRQKCVKPFELKINNEVDDRTNGRQFNGNSTPSHRNQNGGNQRPPTKAVCPLPESRVITNDEKNNIRTLMTRFESLDVLNFEALYRVYLKKPLDYKRFGFETLLQFLEQFPEFVQLVETNGSVRVFSRLCNASKPIPNGRPTPLQNGLQNSLTTDLSNSNVLKQNHLIRAKAVKEFHLILRKNPNGVRVHQFIDEYYKTFKKPFDSTLWGFCSPIEMFVALTDIFYLKPDDKLNNEDRILLESTPELRAKLPTLPKRKKFEEQFKEKVNEMMAKIERTHIKELDINEFSDAYYIFSDEKIDPKTYGFDSLRGLLTSLSKECDFDVKERVKSKPFLVYNKKSDD